MPIQFTPATKHAAKLRLALDGPAGSGKTYTALALASALATPVALVDTEHGSASKYADIFNFATLELDSFHPERYMEAIAAAEQGGFGTLILDSLSHAWSGKDGTLELVDRAAKRSTSGNSFAAWKDVTPIQNALIERILTSRLHIIATLRVKTEYVIQTNDRGKQEPKKVGLAPIQRDQVEYEFDVYGRLDSDNNLVITKTRCSALANAVISKPGADLAKTLSTWLEGAPVAVRGPVTNGDVAFRERDVDDADIVRNADDQAWQSWLQVLAKAQGLDVRVPEIRLPLPRHELKAIAAEAIQGIRAREIQLTAQEAANGRRKVGAH